MDGELCPICGAISHFYEPSATDTLPADKCENGHFYHSATTVKRQDETIDAEVERILAMSDEEIMASATDHERAFGKLMPVFMKELLKLKSELAAKDAEIAELKEVISETHEELWKCGGFIGDLANKGHPYAIAAIRDQLAAAEASNKELRKALKPFAKEESTWAASVSDKYHPGIVEPNQRQAYAKAEFSIGDLRRARAALGDQPK